MVVGLLATLAALVLGLLIASAKGSFDSKQDEIKEGAAKIILLDRTLRHYGPQAEPARVALCRLTAAQTDRTWIESSVQVGVPSAGPLAGIEEVQEKLRALAPASDAQRWLQTRALQLSSELAQMRWLLIDHATVYAVTFASALSVSSAILLILQLDRPFEGLMAMSDAPLRAAIAELNR
jgi:hypothetical protein